MCCRQDHWLNADEELHREMRTHCDKWRKQRRGYCCCSQVGGALAETSDIPVVSGLAKSKQKKATLLGQLISVHTYWGVHSGVQCPDSCWGGAVRSREKVALSRRVANNPALVTSSFFFIIVVIFELIICVTSSRYQWWQRPFTPQDLSTK